MNKKTARLVQLDKQYLWHPFTQMADWLEDDPVIIDSGDGFYLIDTEGNRYIDGVSSLWCNVHGHRVKRIDDAIRAQLDKIAHSTLLGLGQST
ncbi:MAG: aminotransferase class III-fold pyridoxal phosphate-dependent enzyme, partial [Planctomycetota bacterium]